MRHLFQSLVLAASVVTLLAGAEPALAQDRYCLQGRQWGYPGNCQFSSMRQCLATASGTDSFCGVNPQAGYARQRRH
jgi:hypothetical protein